MGLFNKNKDLESKEYTKLLVLVREIETRLDSLEQKMKSLRGIVNRKLGYSDVPVVEKEEKKDIYSGMLLPE